MTSCKFRMHGGAGRWIAAIATAALAHGSWAQPSALSAAASVAASYPPGSIVSTETAERALADVARERTEVEQRFATEKNECLSRFFVSSCEEDAKERRRAALERLRAVEVEANAFKRRARVEERDRALEEKRVQDEKERQERLRQQDENSRQPRTAGKPQQSAAAAAQAPTATSEREARHRAKLRRIEADEAANAQKRADNIAAYQRKVQAAQEHQREVEKRKAEKERERAQHPTAAPEAR